MEWRIAEISNPNTPGFDPNAPWKYEIDAVWESGELASFNSQVSIPDGALDPGKTYRARVRMQDSTGRWSHWSSPVEFMATGAAALPTLQIVEFHYHPDQYPGVLDEEDLEFIEILNTGTQPVNMSGMQLTEFANTPYTFANGTTLAAGERIVVARNPTVLQQVHGPIANLMPTGYIGNNLSNGGETIKLLTAGGAEIASISYTDDPPWPTSPDGGGPSLEIIDPLGNENDAANWRASTAINGTPGTASPMFMPGDFDEDGDVDGRDFLWWQRNTSIGALGDWQTNYGESEELSAVSDSDSDPGITIPGLLLINDGTRSAGTRDTRSGLQVSEVQYFNEVDRAIEQYTPVPSSVRSFGEMVARRGVKMPAR
jgi:hypothetical protein